MLEHEKTSSATVPAVEPKRSRPVSAWHQHRSLLMLAIIVALVGCGLEVAWFLKAHGVNGAGDSAGYVMQAQAYAHGKANISWAINADNHMHWWDGYPLRTYPEVFRGPHGMVSLFEPGLSILLVPFLVTGALFLGPTLGMLTLSVVGLIFLHRRVTLLTGLDTNGQLLLMLFFAGPALWLAVTQVYPDLFAGVLLASGLVELAIIEKRRAVRPASTLIVAAVAAALPWLQIKNLAPAVVLVTIFAVMVVRFARAGHSSVVAYAGLIDIGLSWLLLLSYNLYYFGHLLGYPERPNQFDKQGLEYSLGLLFDQHQGLFVQVPFAVVGLAGLWIARRRYPGAVAATVVALGAVLVLNGTYTSNPFGGGALAGRFMWSLLPALLAWTAVAVRGWQDSGRRLWIPALIVSSAWAYQAWPILSGNHIYYNASQRVWYNAHGYFRQPHAYPGWWQGFNSILPQFNEPAHFLGKPSWSVALELVAVTGCVAAISWLLNRDGMSISDSGVSSSVTSRAVWSWRSWRFERRS